MSVLFISRQADSLNLYNSNNRTYNYFTYKNQTDNYWQNHYQLFFNHQFNLQLSLNIAVFLSIGYGYYEEFQNQQSYTEYSVWIHSRLLLVQIQFLQLI